MLYWVLIGIVILLIVFVLFTMVAHIFLLVPYVPTPKKVITEVLSLAQLKDGERVVDLGAGDARFLIRAQKLFPNIRATGYELAPTIWFLGKLRIWFSRAVIEWRMQNMFRADVQDADCVFVYLLPSAMGKLEEKFTKELRKGTRVISYAFHFPHRKAVETRIVPWLTGTRKLYLYIW